jgi:hypothetical protein
MANKNNNVNFEKENKELIKIIRKYKPNPLESIDTLRKIGQFVNPIDMAQFLCTNKRINNNKKEINFYQRKKMLIIFRFMKKVNKIFKKIKHIKNIDDNSKYGDKPTITTSKTMALYYFKYYENKYLKSWFDFASRHPYNNVSNIVDNTIENPSKYDLFKLQLKLQLKDITHIGW